MRRIVNFYMVFIISICSFFEISAQNNVPNKNSEPGIIEKHRNLSFEEIKSSSTGYYTIKFIDDYYIFERFPTETLQLFSTMPARVIRAESTSGVRLRFLSDTKELKLTGKILADSPQTEPFVILLNDSIFAVIPEKGSAGEFEQILKIPGESENKIEICFPSYSKALIKNLQIDGNTSFRPLEKKGVLFAMGNSITQQGGRYMGYTDIVARGLNLDLHNAGVGGHIFEAESITFAYVENPSIITLAYGTNDWNGSRPADNARIFLDKITSLYPSTPIIMLEPIRRYRPVSKNKNKLAKNKDGVSLEAFRRDLRDIAKDYPTVKIIHYKKLMPDDPSLFPDGVHPSDSGHIIFGENLLRIIKREIPELSGNKL